MVESRDILTMDREIAQRGARGITDWGDYLQAAGDALADTLARTNNAWDPNSDLGRELARVRYPERSDELVADHRDLVASVHATGGNLLSSERHISETDEAMSTVNAQA